MDPLGVEAVGGLVEDQHVCGSPSSAAAIAEPLAHAEREAADALARDVVEADQVDHLVDARAADAVGLGEREQVVVGRAAGVDGARLEHRADLVQRRGEVAVGASVDGDRARGGRVEPEDQTHRRRLAGAVGAEEAR